MYSRVVLLIYCCDLIRWSQDSTCWYPGRTGAGSRLCSGSCRGCGRCTGEWWGGPPPGTWSSYHSGRTWPSARLGIKRTQCIVVFPYNLRRKGKKSSLWEETKRVYLNDILKRRGHLLVYMAINQRRWHFAFHSENFEYCLVIDEIKQFHHFQLQYM